MTDRVYHNPVLKADWSDPDVIRVGADFYLVASSFHRVPGLPVLHSRDLVNWTIAGHALARLEPAAAFATPQHGCGVWAPAIRHHAGRFWIFYPDPDRGIYVVTAPAAGGPWTRPRLLKGGSGLIDPCPMWDSDGSAYLVHAWARSRAGFNNRITCHRMTPDATQVLDEGRTVVDGDRLPGYRTLEGPKLYRRGDWYWIFAPAGGVAHGWQSAFRSRSVFGPYEGRIVLAQGDTDVNGPHQGAWVDTPGGQDWFLHFQDRGAYGRVVHLQPMSWTADDWPRIGAQAGDRPGTPVSTYRMPDVRAGGPAPDVRAGGPAPATAADAAPATPDDLVRDDFAAGTPGPRWTWPANPDPSWWTARRPAGLRLACVRSPGLADLRRLPNVLGQRLPGTPCAATAALTLDSDVPGARAGLTVLGRSYAWIGLERTDRGARLVCRTAAAGAEAEEDLAEPVPAPAAASTVVLRVEIGPGATCRFSAATGSGGPSPIGGSFTATPGHWVGATLGVFAAAPPGKGLAGHAEVEYVELAGVG